MIVDDDNNLIGRVTSGTQSPSLLIGIGLGYVEKSYSKIGTKIGILIRDKKCTARVVKPPFIKS
jgi:aminomethyltransferase